MKMRDIYFYKVTFIILWVWSKWISNRRSWQGESVVKKEM